MQYRLVMDSSLERFQNAVNELLSAGWNVQGGIAVGIKPIDNRTIVVYYQAMTKLVEENS